MVKQEGIINECFLWILNAELSHDEQQDILFKEVSYIFTGRV